LWLVALALLPVYVAIALRYPTRPPQDRIAGTYLVPA
jgi:eukaryotic-like serine/threonine-protein kinase